MQTRMTRSAGLWTVQVALAALFLFAGWMKLVMPIEELTAQSTSWLTSSGGFLRFIGAAEFLGAIGLILPGLLGIRRELTPLAAAGLVVIMIGATVVSVAQGPVALVPLAVGALAALVAYGRRDVVFASRRTV